MCVSFFSVSFKVFHISLYLCLSVSSKSIFLFSVSFKLLHLSLSSLVLYLTNCFALSLKDSVIQIFFSNLEIGMKMPSMHSFYLNNFPKNA